MDCIIYEQSENFGGHLFSPKAVGGTGLAGLTYNSEASFVFVGKYYDMGSGLDVASEMHCEIYTRVQFDGPVDALFEEISWNVSVNTTRMLGAATYAYGTET